MALDSLLYGTSKIYMFQNGVAVPQPVQVGVTQDFSFDIDKSSKPLQGGTDAPVAIASGAMKISGSLKAAKFKLLDVNNLMFGQTMSTGSTVTADNEGAPTGTAIPTPTTLVTSAATATGSTLTFSATTGVVAGQSVSGTNIAAGTTVASLTSTTVTLSQAVTGTVASGASITFGPSITVANAATFIEDAGVIYAATGIQLKCVASAPTTGQYAVNAGVYTFAAADAGLFVLPSYVCTKTTGNNFTYYAQPMGFRPTFMIVASNPSRTNNPAYPGTGFSLTVWNAGIDKFSLDFKNEDWTIPESSWSASQDFQGRVFTFSGDVN
jgi:hypothetical protein